MGMIRQIESEKLYFDEKQIPAFDKCDSILAKIIYS
jgi:hypothetical protein